MKIRSGFVSNSSSSSFIISLENDIIVSNGDTTINLDSLIAPSKILTTEEELVNYFHSEYISFGNDYTHDKKLHECSEQLSFFDEALYEIREGRKVVEYEFDYDDYKLKQMVSNFAYTIID